MFFLSLQNTFFLYEWRLNILNTSFKINVFIKHAIVLKYILYEKKKFTFFLLNELIEKIKNLC